MVAVVLGVGSALAGVALAGGAMQSCGVGAGEEGLRFCVDHVQQGEFPVLCHDFCHLPAGIDDRRTDQARVGILLERDVGVVAVRASGFAGIGTGGGVYHPLVHHAARGFDTSLHWRYGVGRRKLVAGAGHGVVRVIGAFAVLGVLQSHGVHRGVIRGHLVDEHDFDQIAHLGTDGRALGALPWWLLTVLGERGVGVAAIEGLEPFRAQGIRAG